MTQRKLDEELGLDMPLGEARERFAKVTKETTPPSALPAIPDGQMEVIPFKAEHIRRIFHNDEWWYSVVDVLGALVGTARARKYWSDLKIKLIKEGFTELSDKIGQLPLVSADGKKYRTDVATTETLFRVIQTVSSPRAEPFKRWLAKIGYERIQEAQDPEIAIKRAILAYQIQGRSDDWIEKRIRSMVARKELTAEWQKRGVVKEEYAILTTVISQETFGVHTEGHKRIKGLRQKHSLRDHMTDMELILTMLAETSTKQIAQRKDARGYYQNFEAAKAGGGIAGSTRRHIEAQTGEKVVSSQNFLGERSRQSDPIALTKKK